MSSKTPVVQQTAWISLVPHIFIMGAIVLIWYFIKPEKAVMYGALTYLILSFGLRSLIPHNHRKGMSYVRNQEFKEAISEFEKSYAYFTSNNWIDAYRYVTLLSSQNDLQGNGFGQYCVLLRSTG